MKHSNRLAAEKSPYLLQHAHNPVDWYAWGDEAFEAARRENKPIFLSVGYSTCHWCHVMERESFEDEQTAAVLNRYYIPVKVDREERPDVDRVYMTFVQATTGGGGWPMSVWLTPDLKPFFGGTYFPPDNRYGRPGFKAVLERVAEAWRQDREQIVESAADVVSQLQKQVAVEPVGAGSLLILDPRTLDAGFFAFRRSFDSSLGGFGGAPKFPRPSVHNFLLRYYHRTGNGEALDMVLVTLRQMARGGMHDQLGGGFHRYAVDERWFVPHFEKMLYDQAQLAISYLEAFQITGEMEFAETARRTLDYVLRDLRDSGGAFRSAEDADSARDAAHPNDKGEGAFYIWSQDEIDSLLDGPAAAWFRYRYGVEEKGNVDADPHGEFTGRNILYRAHSVEDTAGHFNRPVDEVRTALLQAGRILLEARDSRPRPHLDDKVLTSWNGLMISAFAKAAAVLREPPYGEAAREAAAFVLTRMYDQGSGILLRRYRDGDAAIPGFLDDYAFFAQALLDLYETDLDFRHLEAALRLTEKMCSLFEDRQQGAFFSSAAGDPALVMRIKEDYDGAEPSGNSIAVLNLLRLAGFTGRGGLKESAERALAAFAPRISAAPAGVPQMLVACEFLLAPPQQVVIAGGIGAPDTLALAHAVHARFLPHHLLMLAGEPLARWNPAVSAMTPVEGSAAAYVCRDFTCQLPVSDPASLDQLLQ